jgi:hypothetical protein
MTQQQYENYLASDRWQIIATKAKERAHHQCALCWRRRRLEVHHRTYERLGHEWVTDLVVLCWWCHRLHHGTLKSSRRCSDQQLLLPFTPLIPTGPDLN